MPASGSRTRRLRNRWRRLRHGRTADRPKQPPSLSPLASLSSESTVDTIRAKLRTLHSTQFPPKFYLELGCLDSLSRRIEAASLLEEMNGLIEDVATTYGAVLHEKAPKYEPVLIFGSESGLPSSKKETPAEKAARERAEEKLRFYRELADKRRMRGEEYIERRWGNEIKRRLSKHMEDEQIAYEAKLLHKVTSWAENCLRVGCVGWPGSPFKIDKQLDLAVGGDIIEENDVWKQELEELRRTYRRG